MDGGRRRRGVPRIGGVTGEEEAGIAGWLVDFALRSDDEAGLLGGFCDRLVAAGVPLLRVAAGSEAFHPTLDARGTRWNRGSGVRREEYTREEAEANEEEWRQSPFFVLAETDATELRRRLGDNYEQGEFGLLDRFVRDDGMTDYLALAVPYGPGSTLGVVPGLVVSYQTDRRGGFADPELALLRRLTRPFALACKGIAGVRTGRSLLETYLGADPARRVLDGAIVRGRAEPVQAVLWYSDLQGFTRIADTAPRDQVLELLNRYADCLVSTIGARGGEVLKFIGDGILAMFPLGEDHPCAKALDAAGAALRNVDELNERRRGEGLPWTDVHLALHVGEVLYGNIGSRERLDFTVVGPAVNEVARIEAMCRSLDQRVVTSSAFAAAAAAAGDARSRLVSLGRYALRGVRRPEELFTIDPGAG
jgi:adenylate cyclase